MNAKKIIEVNKSQILEEWFKLVILSYPSESSKYFLKKDNRFSNPVGYTIYTQLELLIEYLYKPAWNERYDLALEQILKIRAVQSQDPSVAVGFVLKLDEAIKNALKLKGIILEDSEQQIISSVIENMLLKAFDRYMEIREKLSEIRINEIKANTKLMIDKINRKYRSMGLSDD